MVESVWVRLLRWIAAWIGIAALFLPALSFSAPGVAAQWSTLQVAASLGGAAHSGSSSGRAQGQPTVGEVLHQVSNLRRQWQELGGRSSAAIPWAYRLAVAIPFTLLLAGVCAVVVWVAMAGGWRRLMAAAAIAGAASAAYAIGAAALLTQAMHREIAAVAQRAQHALPFLSLGELGAQLRADVRISGEAGAFLLLAAFLAALFLPAARGRSA